MDCEAKGRGWVCDREAVGKGLCPGHYNQKARGKGLRPLRGAHGASGEDLQPVTFLAPAGDVNTLSKEARRRDVRPSEVYREAFAQLAEKLDRK